MKEETQNEIILWAIIFIIFICFTIGIGAGKTEVITTECVEGKLIENKNNDQDYFLFLSNKKLIEVDKQKYMECNIGDSIQIRTLK